MRHGSSCLPWEPVRCSTDISNCSGIDNSDTRSSVLSHASHKPCLARPTPRQWTSWSGNNSNIDSEIKSTSGQVTSKLESFSKNVSAPKSMVPNCPTLSFYASRESVKTLPTRTKSVPDPQQPNLAHRSVEENRLRCAAKSQKESAKPNYPVLQRPAPAIEVNVARSRCHPRRRPCSDATPTSTPKLRRDTDCTDAIVRLIVFFSTKLVHTIWSQASNTPKTSKDFNGAGVLPLQVFIQETLRRSKTSYSTLQVALFYLILLRPHVKPCQATQQQYTPGCRALQCGRRMFLTALILASKYLQDRNYSARAWSKISGLPVAEINENERHYLELIKYNLHMSKETFENWSKMVLTVCKASGQGPFGGKPDSPPSSPSGLSCSADFEQPGSSGWWLHHLVRLTPDVVKSTHATDEYLAGLLVGTPVVDSGLTLDTPPSSPESIEEILSDHSSPLVQPSTGPGHTNTIQKLELGLSPASIGTIPRRPLPPNLPTPQTTPRYDSAFTFSRKPSQTDLRCRASLQALIGVDKQSCAQANLETCPPPKPRSCMGVPSNPGHPLRESHEPSNSSWMSSPESSFSDSSSSSTTRSRSSSISSVSSVWSAAGAFARQNESKQRSAPHIETQQPSYCVPLHNRTNIGSYSFYHPIGNVRLNSDGIKCNGSSSSPDDSHCIARPELQRKNSDLNENQIAQLLASLSSQSDDQVQYRTTDPAVIGASDQNSLARVNIGPAKKHKRNRPSKEDGILQEEIRQFLWHEHPSVCVEDDKKPTNYVETPDKEAQYPLQSWAHPKKPVPNAMKTKRIALQHPSSEQHHATQLAADYLRHSVSVM